MGNAGQVAAAAGLVASAMLLSSRRGPTTTSLRRAGGGTLVGRAHRHRMLQARDRHGRFACEPDYPRLRTSACGCAGGLNRPCPVGRHFEHVRQQALQRYAERRNDVEARLYAVEEERRGVRQALDTTRARIAAAGRLHHSVGRTGRRTYSVVGAEGVESERAYQDLLEERRQLRAHLRHLDGEASGLRADHRRSRRHQPALERLFAA